MKKHDQEDLTVGQKVTLYAFALGAYGFLIFSFCGAF